jgi:hypothetical protein
MYSIFLQKELTLIVGRVVSEYMSKTTTYVVLALPLDFFLWGVLKERVYQTPVLTIEKLKEFVSISP